MNKDSKSELWHYTTEEGLFGILKSQQLWATDYRYLNDSTELQYGRKGLQVELFQYIYAFIEDESKKNHLLKDFVDKNGGIKIIATNEAKDTIDIIWGGAMEMEPSLTPCILSFCFSKENNDNEGLLSQWRGYGRDGGYALIFNFIKTLEFFDQEINAFKHSFGGHGDVCYDPHSLTNDTQLFKHRDQLIDFARKLFYSRVYKTPTPYPGAEIPKALVHCLSRFKHHGFREEGEYRCFMFAYADPKSAQKVYDKHDPNDQRPFKEIHFRIGSNGIDRKPYIKLFEGIGNLPIDRIVVGPHRDKEKRAEFVRIYLKNRGLNHIKVYSSDIPYLGAHV